MKLRTMQVHACMKKGRCGPLVNDSANVRSPTWAEIQPGKVPGVARCARAREEAPAKKGSPKAPQVLQLLQLQINRLEQQLQSELDVAPLVIRLASVTIHATLLGLDERSRQ
jgi:hypothetical protein